MNPLIAFILSAIILSLSYIHIYWAFGGIWGFNVLILTNHTDEKAVMSGMISPLTMVQEAFSFCNYNFKHHWKK